GAARGSPARSTPGSRSRGRAPPDRSPWREGDPAPPSPPRIRPARDAPRGPRIPAASASRRSTAEQTARAERGRGRRGRDPARRPRAPVGRGPGGGLELRQEDDQPREEPERLHDADDDEGIRPDRVEQE